MESRLDSHSSDVERNVYAYVSLMPPTKTLWEFTGGDLPGGRSVTSRGGLQNPGKTTSTGIASPKAEAGTTFLLESIGELLMIVARMEDDVATLAPRFWWSSSRNISRWPRIPYSHPCSADSRHHKDTGGTWKTKSQVGHVWICSFVQRCARENAHLALNILVTLIKQTKRLCMCVTHWPSMERRRRWTRRRPKLDEESTMKELILTTASSTYH